MGNKNNCVILSKISLSLTLVVSLIACSSAVTRTELQEISQIPDTTTANMYDPSPESGVVPYVWSPPIVDVVDVPPGLDPEGHYYRPAHKEIVEIRPGRWEYFDKNKSR